jgi:hypothetical protein
MVRAYILIQNEVGASREVAREVARIKGVTSAEAVTGSFQSCWSQARSSKAARRSLLLDSPNLLTSPTSRHAFNFSSTRMTSMPIDVSSSGRGCQPLGGEYRSHRESSQASHAEAPCGNI